MFLTQSTNFERDSRKISFVTLDHEVLCVISPRYSSKENGGWRNVSRDEVINLVFKMISGFLYSYNTFNINLNKLR